MTTTRWKLTAGGLVLALGGLAAVAGVPARSCQPEKASSSGLVEIPTVAATPYPPVVGRAVYSQPVDTPPAPATPAVPTAPEPELPAPSSVATPAEVPSLPPPVVKAERKPEPKEDKVYELKVPLVEAVKPTAAATPIPLEPKPVDPRPEPTPVPVTPPLTIMSEPVLPAPAKEPELPKPTPASKPVPVAELPTPKPVQPATEAADPLLAAPPAPTPGLIEKKLKVILHMGDDRPRFEVRDGDEVYLKVNCDKVDVKSPSDQGDAMSTLKSTGRVSFVTPGGEGTCDELTVIPGTGQVVVSGRVSYKYSWGKVQTVVSGDKMTFRLGSTPGVSSDTFQASHQQTR